MSHEETIYDILTEIPHYFDLDHKFRDDMNFKEIKVKQYEDILIDKIKENSSKSVGKIKSVKEGLRIKSVLSCTNCKEKEKKDKDSCMNLISACENKIISEKACFKYYNEDNSYKTHPGFVEVTDYRVIFKFDEDNFDVVGNFSLAESYFSIPLFCITR